MGARPDVLVVGGGVIGLTSAYLLAKAGLRVEVIDKGVMGREASWAGAGILPPWGDGEYATPLDHLRAYSVSRFAELSARLCAETYCDNEYHVCGGVEHLSAEDADQVDLWRREGIAFELLHGSGPDRTATYRLAFAQVRNPRHLLALLEGCEGRCVDLRPHARFDLCGVGREQQVVLTAGAWTAELLEPLGVPLPVHPVRGQMVLLNPGRPVLRHIVNLGKRYLVPRLDGRVLVGSTEEPGAGFAKVSTPDGVAGLINFAHSLLPELRGATVEATWAGLRPGSADGLPYIGRVPGFDNVIVAAGHFRAGIQTSIGTAACVRALVLGEPPPVPLEAFAPGRTPHPPLRTAFRS